jgi:hypothetical protein
MPYIVYALQNRLGKTGMKNIVLAEIIIMNVLIKILRVMPLII